MRLAPWLNAKPTKQLCRSAAAKRSKLLTQYSCNVGRHSTLTQRHLQSRKRVTISPQPRLSWQKMLSCNKLGRSVMLRNLLEKQLASDNQQMLEGHFSSLSSQGSPMPLCKQRERQPNYQQPQQQHHQQPQRIMAAHPLSRCNGRSPQSSSTVDAAR